MILVHNHPSGELSPSQKDQDFTDRMLKVGKLINIEVIDHLIISEESYLSFAEQGIIKQLQQSGLYEIVEREKIQIQEWKLKLEREQAEKDKALDIATKMKGDGLDEDTIKKYTGLTKWEIRKL